MKIELRNGSMPKVLDWAEELNRNSNAVLATLEAEGVAVEAAFLDHQADGDYLIYMMRSRDFENAHRVGANSTSPIDEYHRAFKADCWESRIALRRLIDFEVPVSVGDGQKSS